MAGGKGTVPFGNGRRDRNRPGTRTPSPRTRPNPTRLIPIIVGCVGTNQRCQEPLFKKGEAYSRHRRVV